MRAESERAFWTRLGELLESREIALFRALPHERMEPRNRCATLLLESVDGGPLPAALGRLATQVTHTGGVVEAKLRHGAGLLQVHATKLAPDSDDILVLVGVSSQCRCTALSQLLNLAASGTAELDDARVVISSSLKALGISLQAYQVAVFEQQGPLILPRASVDLHSGFARLLLARRADPPTCAISLALSRQTPVSVAALTDPVLTGESVSPTAPEASALAYPIPAQVPTVLWIVGPPGWQQVDALRLVVDAAVLIAGITERHRELRRLRAERDQLAAVLSELPEVVLEQGPSGAVVSTSGPVTRMLALSPQDLLGLPVAALFAPEDESSLTGLLDDAACGRRRRAIVRARHDPSRFLEVSPSGGERNGRPVLRLVVRDVSPQKELERKLDHAQQVATSRDRLAAIGQLTAGIAHEINNPLAYLKSSLGELERLLRTPGENPSELHEVLADARDGVERIIRIVQALKGTVHARTDQVRFDPSGPLQNAITVFRGARKARCELDVDIGACPTVVGAPGSLGQLVINLLDNALDAMGGTGRIEVRAGRVGESFRLTIRDHGPGIHPEIAARMFEPFFTTKDVGHGTGLGLSICRDIVAGMSGRIWFETGPDGTTFHVLIPQVAAQDDDDDLQVSSTG